MIRKILIALIAIILIFVVLVATRPDDFRYTRSITIGAPVDVVFAQVNDFRQWELWSPWAKLDPNSKTIYEGSTTGVGSVFKWSGNDKVGEGSQTIVESRANEFIEIKLDFSKPFKGTHNAQFTFKPEGNLTTVSWSMYGKNDFMGKAICVLMNCDKMMGDQFEKGLGQLKVVSEGLSK